MKGELGPRVSPFNSRLTCMRPYFIISVLLFCVFACVLVFVIGLRSDTELNAAHLFKNIANRRGKAAFHERHHGGKKAAVAAARNTRSVAVTTRTVATPSTTVSRVGVGASMSAKGGASVYDALTVQTDAPVDAGKQEEDGKAGSDQVENGSATTRNGGSGGDESRPTGAAAAAERQRASATNANARGNGTNDRGVLVTDDH